MAILVGLDSINSQNQDQFFKGNVGLLCHSASVNGKLQFAPDILLKLLGPRLKKLFGPQHGLVTDVQDNMVETQDFIHPHYKIPVHSLYSTTRRPTDKMLEGLDTLVVDLQDVGTRVYTYITTLAEAMEACAQKGIRVVVLDRPNPVGGEIIEGPVLKDKWRSFVGHHPIPQRHALTMGEIALLTKKIFKLDIDLKIVPMQGWKRSMFWKETGLPWVNPSPNLPTSDGALVFVGSVLFEGTNLSEGRGTTRSLEMIGHPHFEAFSKASHFQSKLDQCGLMGIYLRPLVFLPMFQKHQGRACGGFQIHVTDAHKARPWMVGQILCQEFYHLLGKDFSWRSEAYEYEYDRLAIDLINGDEDVRTWVEKKQDFDKLEEINKRGHQEFRQLSHEIRLYE